MRSWFSRLAAGLTVLGFLAGAARMARADTIIVEVGTNGNVFSPSTVSIATGDTIRWVWISGTHDTTSADGLWASGDQGQGSTFEYTFATAGTYNYFCARHVACCGMRGTINVFDPVILTGSLNPADIDPNASGEASFEMVPYRSTLSVVVAAVSSTGVVDVFVNGNFIGTIFLDGNGNGELDLNTDNGDSVPDLQDGDEIEVYDASDDATLILIGNVQSGP
jgi:plastocyanin